MDIITIFFVSLQPKCLDYFPPFRAGLARQLVDLPDGRDAVPGLSKLLLLARAIKFVFCDSTVAAFLLRVCAIWTGVGESARGAARWAAPLLYPSIFAAIICDNRVFRSDNNNSRSDIPAFGLTASIFRQSCIADCGQ